MINYAHTAESTLPLPLSECTHKYTQNNLDKCRHRVRTLCVRVGHWPVGWGAWLLTLCSEVRQQTASQLGISISKTQRTSHAHTTSKIPSFLQVVSHFLPLWILG